MTSGTIPRALGISIGLAIVALAAPPIAVAQQPENASEALTTQHPWIGQPAPDLELVTTSGETVSLGDYRGNKFVVLHFAASW